MLMQPAPTAASSVERQCQLCARATGRAVHQQSSATAGLAFLVALSISGCSPGTAPDARRYQLTGVVVGREASPLRVVVAHDAVEGLMPAMSMAFESGHAAPVRDGDRIAATLVVTTAGAGSRT